MTHVLKAIGIMASSRDIFAQGSSIAQSILEGAAVNEGHLALNRMALVGCCWHNVLAPPAGACIPALTRQVTLGQPDMLAVAEIVRPWWRCLRARHSLYLSSCNQIRDAGLASLAAGCTAITSLTLSYCDQITDAGLASLATECPNIQIEK